MELIVKVPANFNADDYVIGFSTKSKNHIRDGLNLFVSYLTDWSKNKKKAESFIETGFIPLNAKRLKGSIGSRYTRVRDILIQNGVVESNRSWVGGKRSTGFRLTSPYMGATRAVLIQNPQILQNIQPFLKKKQEDQYDFEQKLPYLAKWLTNKHLTVEESGAFFFIECYRRLMLQKLAGYNGESPGKVQRKVFLMLKNMNENIQNVKESLEVNRKRDERGRVYTPVVSMKKQLRNFLLVDGESAVNVDLKSSQPYLLQILLKKSYWERLKNIKNNKIYKPPIKTINTTIMLLDSLEVNSGENVSGFRILSINWKSDFYQWVVNEIPKHESDPGIISQYDHRDKVKIPILTAFYEQGRYKRDFSRLLSLILPKETTFLKVIKRGDHSIASKLLQSVESELMIDTICKMFSREYPDSPFFTVHDSVIVKQNDAARIREIMVSVLTEATGSEPGVSIEHYDPDKLISNIQTVVEKDWEKILGKLHEFKGHSSPLTAEEQSIFHPPLLYKIPEWRDRKIISTRYVDSNTQFDEFEFDDVDQAIA